MNQFPHYSPETRSVQWYTPPEVLDKVLTFFGGRVDLDPCSDSKAFPNVPCIRCFSSQDDGLSQIWAASTVFVNHPYKDSKTWIPYARKMYDEGHSQEIVLLIKFDPSTKWFASLASFPLILIDHRLKFIRGTGTEPSASANFPSALVYMGDRVDAFITTFRSLGHPYVPFPKQ